MKERGVLFGWTVTLAFLGDDVQQYRSDHVIPHSFEDGGELFEIVAVDGTHIFEAEILEDDVGHQDVHHRFFQLLSAIDEAAANVVRQAVAELPDLLFEGVVATRGHHPGHVFLEAAHVFGDGHGVVVEDHDKTVRLQVTGMVESLKAHAPCERSISYHGNVMRLFLLQQSGGTGQTQRRGNGSAAVTSAEGIIGTFIPVGKPADAIHDP